MDLCDKQGTRSALVHAELLLCTEYLYIRIESDHSLACTASAQVCHSAPHAPISCLTLMGLAGFIRVHSRLNLSCSETVKGRLSEAMVGGITFSNDSRFCRLQSRTLYIHRCSLR